MNESKGLFITVGVIVALLIFLSFNSVLKDHRRTKATLQKIQLSNDSIQTLLDDAHSEIKDIQKRLELAVSTSQSNSNAIRSNVNSQKSRYEAEIQSIRYDDITLDELVIRLNGSIFVWYPFD